MLVAEQFLTPLTRIFPVSMQTHMLQETTIRYVASVAHFARKVLIVFIHMALQHLKSAKFALTFGAAQDFAIKLKRYYMVR